MKILIIFNKINIYANLVFAFGYYCFLRFLRVNLVPVPGNSDSGQILNTQSGFPAVPQKKKPEPASFH